MKKKTNTPSATTSAFASLIVIGGVMGLLTHTDFQHGMAIGIIVAGAVAMGLSLSRDATK